MLPDNFSQIERTDTLVDAIKQQITEAVINGTLVPGQKLVETQLSEQLGVSRAPIREAIRHLEQMGLVEKIPYRGTFVSRLTRHDIKELHNIREALEGMAARILAQEREPDVLHELEALLERMRDAATKEDRRRLIALDLEFHDALIELTGYKLFREIWRPVKIQLQRFLLLKRNRLYSSLDQGVLLHEPIVTAILAGDPDAAEGEVRRHVRAAGEELEGYYEPDDDTGATSTEGAE